MSKGKTISEESTNQLQSLCDEMFNGWQHFDSKDAECRFVKRIVRNRQRQRRVRLYWWSGIAASLLIIIGMVLGWNGKTRLVKPRYIARETSLKAPEGRDLLITLPDRSRVRLRSGSRITYVCGFSRTHRELTLEGQAVFDVRHRADLPMRIHTPHLVITDLGTVFSVSDKAASHKASVTLYSGKASVQGNRPLAKSYTLKPHETITINTEGELVAWTRPVAQPKPKPVDHNLFFENARLEDIADRLSEVYNVEIDVAPAVSSQRFDGYFNSKDDKLEDILDALTQTQGIHYSKNGDKYHIH